MSATNQLHVGIVLDGNRRWAKAQGLPTLEGHRRGGEVFKKIAHAAFDRGVTCLSAFVFSTENWSRTDEEVGYLMNLVMKAVESYLDEFNERGIRIVVLGRRDGIRKKVLDAIKKTEDKTAGNTNGTLALCFNYGGQQEIVDACQKLVQLGVNPEEITQESFRQALYNSEVPDVDLLIRTSGEQRTSGFMLYRAAYSELYFTEKLWPDFTEEDLDTALKNYHERSRRFGS
jgi:undecaprenyl diphosphate synthase